jgi:tetratricopeptide (TPR) repeat protein
LPVYDAFISYSHAKDKPIAAALQAVIQKLGKPWYRRRGLRVFRDDTSLSATPSLWPTIEQALAQSRYLLLLCSPESAASPWVGKEVEYWLGHKSIDTLLIGVTSGTLDWDNDKSDFRWKPAPPLPAVLQGRFAAEPKWVDLTAYRQQADPRDTRFLDVGADFAATIHGMPKEDLLSQEVRQQKRALRLAVGAAALLLLLAVGAVTAGVIAKIQAERAERNFAAAKDTVNGLIFQIAQGLRNVEGIRVESLDKILGQARKTVERLTETDPANVELLRSKAAMLDEFAQTYLAAGNLDAALKNAEEGLAIQRRIAEADGGQQALRNLSVGLVRIGDVKREQGDSAGALAAYEESLALRKTIASMEGDGAQAEFDVTVTLERIADLKRRMGDSAGALAAYEQSLAIRQRLDTSPQVDAEARRGVLVSLGKICDLKRQTGDASGALEACNGMLDRARRLAASDEGNTDWQRDLAIALEQLGGLKLGAGDPAGAAENYDESLTIRRRLAALDPGNTNWQRDVAIGLGLIGDVRATLGDKSASLKAQEESLVTLRNLAEADPNNNEWRQDVSIALDRVGYARVMSGDLPGALAAFEERLAVARELAEIDRSNLAWQRSVAVALNRIGITRQAALDQAGALAAYEESLAIARDIAAADPDNVMRQPDIAVVLQKIGAIRLAAGDYDGALAAYEECLAIARRMVEALPGNEVWQQDVRANLEKIEQIKQLQRGSGAP